MTTAAATAMHWRVKSKINKENIQNKQTQQRHGTLVDFINNNMIRKRQQAGKVLKTDDEVLHYDVVVLDEHFPEKQRNKNYI